MAQAHQQQQQSQSQPASNPDRRRVKVYELKNNDWYDRGTGFCSGQIVNSPASTLENPDARILVVSEEEANRALLETRITKDDGYQKQQDTLIVWTESNGVDMALSFQEAEGCGAIWEFVNEIQQRLSALAPDDGLSDELLDTGHHITLPAPEFGRLEEVEMQIRGAATTQAGREALVKFIMSPEQMYILKIGQLVSQAEEEHRLDDLHKLCTIMKHLILLNDSSIIESVVSDQAIMGVVGALEYDPDFPSHRANHRQYLSDSSKFKEVVHIDDVDVRRRIHLTYRLLYLKDVVLARILDDPTFSVLNSLIFFYQVDIVNHLQQNEDFLRELFGIFDAGDDKKREKDAVLFIRDCCAVSKNIQAQSRAQLYNNFITHGLFKVITYALRHHEAQVRVAGTDILVALIDHDPGLVRNHIFTAIKDKTTPLTDILIELLLVEVDLGVKSQMADATKILLDPSSANGMDMLARQANAELLAKRAGASGINGHHAGPQATPQTEAFISQFYEEGAKRLFCPLKELEHKSAAQIKAGLGVQETSLLTHLVEVLCFFVRQHTYRSKLFILSEGLHARIAQLLVAKQKFLKLVALKWFRTCIGLQDEFHNRQLIQHRLFEPILEIVYETMPRDNLLNSACLELFEYIKREGVKQLIVHLVEQYRDRLMGISYVNVFQAIVLKYDQLQSGYISGAGAGANGLDESSFTTQEGGTPLRHTVNGRQSFAGLKEMDGDEAAYFDNVDDELDDEEEDGGALPMLTGKVGIGIGTPNGVRRHGRPLVDYAMDEDEDELEPQSEKMHDILASSPDRMPEKKGSSSSDLEGADADADAEMDADAPGEPMDTSPTTADENTSPTTTQEERSRGRDRRPVPMEGSPGRQMSRSPPEPSPMKRRRADEDDEDELGKMMGGSKRRNSAASISSQAGRVQLDGSSSPTGVQVQHQRLDDGEGGEVQVQAKQPMLRRKGSLKTKNEGNAGRFAIKPIGLAAAKSPAEEENGHSQGGDGGGDSGGGDG